MLFPWRNLVNFHIKQLQIFKSRERISVSADTYFSRLILSVSEIELLLCQSRVTNGDENLFYLSLLATEYYNCVLW